MWKAQSIYILEPCRLVFSILDCKKKKKDLGESWNRRRGLKTLSQAGDNIKGGLKMI